MISFSLLGSGGGMPTPERFLSSAMISYQGRKILIDAGEGIQVSIQMLRLGFKNIDVICITHLHGDHINGLFGLLSTIGNSGRIDEILLIGPEDVENLKKAIDILVPYLPFPLKILKACDKINLSLNTGRLLYSEEGNIVINTMKLLHSSPCVGYSFYFKREAKFLIDKAIRNEVPKIIWGKLQKEEQVTFGNKEYTKDMVLGDKRRGLKISFITDTRPIEDIISFIRDSDLFVCEGTYAKDKDIDKAIKNNHMTFKEASILAKKSNVSELILTHFSPAIKEPRDYISNANNEFYKVTIGDDGLSKELKFID